MNKKLEHDHSNLRVAHAALATFIAAMNVRIEEELKPQEGGCSSPSRSNHSKGTWSYKGEVCSRPLRDCKSSKIEMNCNFIVKSI